MMESCLSNNVEDMEHHFVEDLKKDLSLDFTALSRPQGGGQKGHLEVYLRIKPFTAAESNGDESQDCVKLESADTVLLKPPPYPSRLSEKALPQTEQRFQFSQVYGPETTQKDLFDGTVKDLVKHVMEGGNSLVFTYGVTNAGKTFTFLGPDRDAGILPRSLNMIFSCIEDRVSLQMSMKPLRCCEFSRLTKEQQAEEALSKRNLLRHLKENERSSASQLSSTSKSCLEGSSLLASSSVMEEALALDLDPNTRYSVWVSFCEIYNDNIHDLLEPCPVGATRRTVLRLSQDIKGNSFVKDLRWVQVSCAEEAFKVMKLGRRNQSFSSTKLNNTSSRSHSIFSIRVLSIDEVGIPRVHCISELSLCDLAGSERCAKTQNKGERLKEAGNINSSLLTLGKCINALRHNQQAKLLKHVPFRDSKLTHYLQGFFCGRGRVCMIVNVNQCASMYDETLNVLKFSAVAKKVEVLATKALPIVPQRSAREVSFIINNADRVAQRHRRSTLIGWERSLEDVQEDADVEDDEEESLMEDTMQEESVVEDEDDKEESLMEDDEERVIVSKMAYQRQGALLKLLQAQLKKEQEKSTLVEERVREEVSRDYSQLFSQMQVDYSERLEREREILQERADRKLEIFKNLVNTMTGTGSNPEEQEERRLKEEVLISLEEERRSKEEVLVSLEEERRSKEEVLVSLEEERKSKEEALVSLEEERRSEEEALVSLEEERKSKEEALVSLEEERRSEEEALLSLAEERRLALASLEEERRVKEEALLSLAEERRLALASLEEERRFKEEVLVSLEDERRLKEEALVSLEDERRLKEEALLSLEEERRLKEEAPVSLEEERRLEEKALASLEEKRRHKEEVLVSLEERRSKEEALVSLEEERRLKEEAQASLEEERRFKAEALVSLEEERTSKAVVLVSLEEERRSKAEVLVSLEEERRSKAEVLVSLEEERRAKAEVLVSLEEMRVKEHAVSTLAEETQSKQELLEEKAKEEVQSALEEEKKAKEELQSALEEEKKAKKEVMVSLEEEKKAKEKLQCALEEEKKAKKEVMVSLEEEKKAKKEVLSKEEEEKMKQIRELEQEVIRAKERLKEQSSQDSEKVKSLSLDLQRKDDETSDLREKLADSKKQIQQVHNEVSSLRVEEKTLRQKLADVEKSRKQLQSELAGRDRTIQQLRTDPSDQTLQLYQQARKELELKQGVVEDMRLALSEQEETQQQLDQALEDKLGIIQELKDELESLKGLLEHHCNSNNTTIQRLTQSEDSKKARKEMLCAQESLKLCTEKHQADRRKWLEEKMTLIGQAKEAEEKRNQEMRKFAEDRERHTKQNSQLEHALAELAENQQIMDSWRQERDSLVAALEVQLQKLMSSNVEKEQLIQQLRSTGSQPPQEIELKTPGEDDILLDSRRGAESPAVVDRNPLVATNLKLRGREEARGSVSSQGSAGYPTVLDSSEISTENGRTSRFPKPELEISFSPLQPNRMALRRQGEQNAVTVKINRSARKRKSTELEKDDLEAENKRNTRSKLTPQKEEGSSPAGRKEGTLWKIGDFLQSSPTLFSTKAKKMMSLVSTRCEADGSSSLRIKKNKKKLYHPDISAPMELPSHPIIRKSEEKDNDHLIIKRRLRSRTAK